MSYIVYYNNIIHETNYHGDIDESKLHRDGDLPAVIQFDGTLKWFKNGKMHREGDKPAFISGWSGNKCWYKNGLTHRDGNKAAVITPYSRSWHKNGNHYNLFKLELLIYMQFFLKLVF